MSTEGTIERVMFRLLSNGSALVGLVGVAGIHRDAAPQDTKPPYCVYLQVGRSPVSSLRGPSGLDHWRVQVESLADKGEQARDVADAVREALQNVMQEEVDGVRVNGCFLEDERTDPESPAHADEMPVRRIVQDWSVWMNR